MTKRDQFALAAMQAMLSNLRAFAFDENTKPGQDLAGWVADQAYLYADAMMMESFRQEQRENNR